MRNPRTTTACIAIAAGLVFAGCADDGDDDGAVVDTTMAPAADDTAATTAAPDAAEETEVVMEGIAFEPDDLTVAVGTTVTWTNNDAVGHTTTSDDGVWDSGVLEQGESFSFTFDEAGTFSYFCEIHPQQMQATVTVEE